MPEPGRPISLGADEDRMDAEGLLAVLRGCHPVRELQTRRDHSRSQASTLELLGTAQAPQAAGTGQVPSDLSMVRFAARAAYAGNPKAPKGGRGLILEHLRPRNILIGNMMERSEQLTAGDLIGYLNRFLAGAVITKDEDLLLTNAGVGNAPLDIDDPDPWTRYRTVGIDPETFHGVDLG